MNTYKCTENDKRWLVSIGDMPPEKKRAVKKLAQKNRRSVSAYIGALLDEEIRKAEAREEKA